MGIRRSGWIRTSVCYRVFRLGPLLKPAIHQNLRSSDDSSWFRLPFTIPVGFCNYNLTRTSREYSLTSSLAACLQLLWLYIRALRTVNDIPQHPLVSPSTRLVGIQSPTCERNYLDLDLLRCKNCMGLIFHRSVVFRCIPCFIPDCHGGN